MVVGNSTPVFNVNGIKKHDFANKKSKSKRIDFHSNSMLITLT